MVNQTRGIGYLAVGILLISGCSGNPLDPLEELKAADGFTLYSLLAESPPPGTVVPAADEEFYEWRAIGKTEIVEPKKKKAIVDALQGAMGKPEVAMARCFNPRHAVRVKRDGLTVDYIICFECARVRKVRKLWFLVFQSIYLSTQMAPQKTLNSYLKEAGIALDPAMKGEI